MRRAIYKIHKWLGLGFGLLLMAQAGSGVLLSFRPQIQGLELSHLVGEGAPVGINEAVAATLREYPEAWAERVYIASAPTGPVTIRLAEGRAPRFVAVSKRRGTPVVAGLPTHGALQWLFEWHEGLWWHGAGRWVLVVQAVLLAGFVVSGLYFWWPLRHKQGLKIKWQALPVRRWYDLHRVAGICAAPILVLALLTGGTMAVRALAAGGAPAPRAMDNQPAWIDEAFECPACGRLKEVRLTADGGYRLIYVSKAAPWPLATDSVAISRDDLVIPRLAQDAALSQKLLGWMYPLHTGKILGWFGQLTVLIAGLMLVLLPVFGWLLWLRRSGKKKPVVYGA